MSRRQRTLAELEQHAAELRTGAGFGGDAVIVCDQLVRIFSTEGVEVQALQGLDLLIQRGELTALVGASGSGKSTLLTLLAGLDTPSAGTARVDGYDLQTMDAKSRLRYRRHAIGFVWQQVGRNLLPYLTVRQNVTLPMRLAADRRTGPGRSARAGRTAELLELLGIPELADRHPGQLSGGQQQRAAIAVALANSPSVLLADEPTGELDTASSAEVFAAFRTVNEEIGTTVLIVTHAPEVAGAVRRTVAIRDGRIATEVVRSTERDEQGREATVSREYTTLDRAGRLQLPRHYTQTLALRRRVLLELEPDHIAVRPGDRPLDGEGAERALRPGGTGAPGGTGSPGAIRSPRATASPGAVETPGATGTPSATETPGATMSPGDEPEEQPR